jgi:sugar phosphate isomerase/epimerase
LILAADGAIMQPAEEPATLHHSQYHPPFARRTMQKHPFPLSRRSFLGGAAALTASAMVPSFASAAGPNSKFNGVQIGVITYSYRSLPGTAEDLLNYITQCGISSIELMGGTPEQFAGAPAGNRSNKKALLDWRLSAPMDRFRDLRKMFNDAGVNIHIVKFGDIGNAGMPDEQIEYYFQVAKALGAKGITREISEPAAERLGAMADKHKIMIGFHNHTQLKPTTYDGKILSYGKYLGINLDIGHYVAGTNHSPIPLIEKYQDRILSLHIKDRKVNNGANMPFGQGDTPVALVLQYMKRHQLTFPADIELEYKVPQDSDAVKEVTKCVKFCEQALA